MSDAHDEAAKAILKVLQRGGIHLCEAEATETIAAALRKAAADEREKFAAHLRNAFYTERDNKAPGVWLFNRYRDTDGDELIQDDRLFPRHADAQKNIDAFVAALLKTLDAPMLTSQPVKLRARGTK